MSLIFEEVDNFASSPVINKKLVFETNIRKYFHSWVVFEKEWAKSCSKISFILDCQWHRDWQKSHYHPRFLALIKPKPSFNDLLLTMTQKMFGLVPYLFYDYFRKPFTVNLRAVDQFTIQFWTILGMLLTETC